MWSQTYYASQKQRIFSRFSFDRTLIANSDLYGSSNMYYPYYAQGITNGRNILLADDYTLNPTSVLQLRYSFTRHYENQTGDPRQKGFNITSLGFPQSLASQVLYQQIPVIAFSTITAIGGTTNEDTFIFASETSDASATYTKVVGKHELSTGLEYRKRFMNEGQPMAPAGYYGFDTTATSSTTFAGDGSDFASCLLGMGEAPGSESGDFTKDIFGAQASPYYAAFIQDNYHVTHSLTINLGLRWDVFGGRTDRHNRLEYFDPTVQYSVSGVALTGGEEFAGVGRSRSPFATNLKDFGPRAGMAWQPVKHLVLRAGAGIYYGPSTQMVANTAFNGDGFTSSTAWNATAYNNDPVTIANTGTGNTVLVNSLSNPFPGGVVQPTGASLGLATVLGGTPSTEFHTQRTPTTYNFNFGIEYEFPREVVLSAAYVGSRGLFLPLAGVDLNQLPLSTIQQYGAALFNNMVPNQWNAILPSTNPFAGQATVPQWMALEPYPQFNDGAISMSNQFNGVTLNAHPGGDSDYSSLQTKVQKRMTKHFTTLAAFTWSKLMTDDMGPPLGFIGYHAAAPQDWRDHLEHAVSAQNVKYQFTWQTSYDLPMGKGRALNLNGVANSALGDWTVNAIVYRSDGVPINAPTGTGDPYFDQRVDMNCDPSKGAPHTAAQWFNWTCFSEPANPLVPGTAAAYLDHVRTAGAHDLDLSLYKNFHLAKETTLRFEVSAYNVTNSVQLGYPNVFWNPSAAANPAVMSGFGMITGDVNTPRQFQFASRFTF